ncbi:MAG: ABC transporter substrate-binding protein [Sulfolobus sp.]|nr:ABC transporter substrate-binding protein [Sulfolobus sp.]
MSKALSFFKATIIVVIVVVAAIATGMSFLYITKNGEHTTTPITITDALGRAVTIPYGPSRIVSIAPSVTQILVSIGLGKQLIGVDYWSYQLLEYLNETYILPPNVTIINSIYPPNTTGIILLYPQIVVADGGLQGEYEQQFQHAGLNVLFLKGTMDTNFSQIESDILLAGEAFDHIKQANDLISWMNELLAKFNSSARNVTIAYIGWINPDGSFYSAGGNTFINGIIKEAGGTNVFQNLSGYPLVSPTQLIIANPDIIIVVAMYNYSYTLQLLNNIPGIQNLTAYKLHHIYILSDGLPEYLLEEPAPLAVYAVGMLDYIINGTAPHYIDTTWIKENLNVTLPIF